jgi:ankyrin repeat protein
MNWFKFILVVIAFPLLSKAQHEKDVFDAIRVKDLKKFEKSIKKGVNINARDEQGFNFLHALFHYCGTLLTSTEEQMLQKLVKAGCDVNAEANNNYKITVLEGAVRSQDATAVEFLIQSGAYVNNGYPLHMACFKRTVSCAKILIEKGADVNKINKDGITPVELLLTYADPYKATTAILEMLHKAGADITIINNKGESLVDLANRNNNWQAANYLIARGVTARIKPPPPPDYGAKKVRLTLSRKYSRNYETTTEYISTIVLIDVTPDKINIYDETATLQYALEVVASNYFNDNGIPGVEYFAKDNSGKSYYVALLQVPDMYTYMNNRQVTITGYNRFRFGSHKNHYHQLDAEW